MATLFVNHIRFFLIFEKPIKKIYKMAKIKFGNIVVDMRGKISGNVYSKNKGGAYSRVRVVPSNPQTSFQSAVRAIFTSLSQAWRGLSATDRASWNSAVGNFSRTNNLGDKHNLSGNALYVSLNKNLDDVNVSPLSTAPSPEAVTPVTVASAVASEGGQTVVVTMGGALDSDTAVKVFASPTLSAGISSPGTKLRQIQVAAPSAVAAISLTTAFLARMGVVGAVGSKIFYELVPVNVNTGQTGAAIRGVIVIGA